MDCIFCKIIKGELPARVIDQNDDVIVFLSLENHPMVVTKKHLENVYQLDDDTGAEVMKMTIKVAKAVKKGLQADGINIIQNNELAAHQDVFHFHLHIKPRWFKDGIRLNFPTKLRGLDADEIYSKIKDTL